MLTFNVSSFNEDTRVAGTLNSEKFNVKYSEELVTALKELQNDYEEVTNYAEHEVWVKKVQSVLDGVSEGDVVTTACQDLMLDERTGNYHVKTDDEISKYPVPAPLVKVILESVDKDIDPTPVVKAWIRFMRNPNFSANKAEYFARYITAEIVDWEEEARLEEEEGYTHEKAVQLSIYNDVAISTEGLIVAKKYAKLLTEGWVIDPETNEAVLEDLYKVNKTVDKFSGEVTETVDYPEFAEELTFEPPIMGRGGNAFLCGDVKDHIIKVGEVIKLQEWSQVDCTDDQFGRPGLHVGGLRYVSAYKSYNNQLLECFVDPAEIGAFVDGEDYAMRVREYFVYGAVKGKTKGIYHSSKYASMKDAEWEEYKRQAIENANKAIDEMF